MTDPTDSLFARAEPLAARALAFDPAVRDTWVSAACADDPALEAEVRTLLRLDAAAPDFLTGTALDDLARADAEALGPEGLAGTHLGPYRLDAFIGSGGMGEVYRAVDDRLGRPVALKLLRDTDDERLQRFEREARTLGRIVHPNVVAVFEFGRDRDVAFLALELVDGESLADRLTRGPLTWRAAAHVGMQIARGLAAAHAEGVLHRDVKPANVMLAPGDVAKLVDFGIARAASPARGDDDPLTMTGAIVGTSGYMAPEQVRGEPLDARTDVFALGAVLYEMVVGRPPFARDTSADAHAAVLRDEVPPLPSSVPPLFARVVMRCLEKVPEARHQSAHDVALLLEAVEDTRREPVPAVALAPPPAAPRRRWTASALVASVLLAGLAVAWFGPDRAVAPPVGVSTAPQRLTFRRGTVFQARFRPGPTGGGAGLVYAAAWEGRASDIYESGGARDPVARNLQGASLLAVGANGDLAILREPLRFRSVTDVGELAVVSGTAAPRSVATQVTSADIARDGRIALTRQAPGGRGARWLVEWPAGTVVHESTRLITNVRIAPTDGALAWLEHGTGTHVMLRASGTTRELHTTMSTTQAGLAWSGDGRAIWFTAARTTTLDDTEIRSVDREGRTRTEFSEGDGLRLLDVGADGRVLVAKARTTVELFVHDAAGTRTTGWLESSFLRDLSRDGRLVLFTEDAAEGFGLYVRRTDGAPAVRIGEQRDLSLARLSPDGTRVSLATDDGGLVIPIGPGANVVLPNGAWPAAWFPDGRRLLTWSASARDGRVAVVDLQHLGAAVPTPLVCDGPPFVSLSGTRVACRVRDGLAVHALGGATRRIDWPAGAQLMGWSRDERHVFAFDDGILPVATRRIDIETGAVGPPVLLSALDAAGVWRIRPVTTTPDGDVTAYSVHRRLDRLYEYRAAH